MASALAVTSCSITKNTAPLASEPFPHEGKILFQGENFKVSGAIGLGTPPPGASSVREFVLPRVLRSAVGGGWRTGWIQLCRQEEVWAIYRGAASADGSMMVKWPACESFDTKSRDNSDLWVQMVPGFFESLSASSPNAALEFKDVPHQYFDPSMTNTVTGRKNVLEVAVVKLSFILAIAAKDPEDNLHVVKHMTWYLNWESTFQGPADNLVPSPVARRTGSGEGNPQDGAPPKLIQALKNPSHVSSNVLAQIFTPTSYATWQGVEHVRARPRRI